MLICKHHLDSDIYIKQRAQHLNGAALSCFRKAVLCLLAFYRMLTILFFLDFSVFSLDEKSFSRGEIIFFCPASTVSSAGVFSVKPPKNSVVLVEFSAVLIKNSTVLIKNSTVLAENTSSRLSFPHTNFMS